MDEAVTTGEEIELGVEILDDLLKGAAALYPPLVVSAPFIMALVRYEASKLKDGITDGSIVSDGKGGFVPASNSRYDPKTGKFIEK